MNLTAGAVSEDEYNSFLDNAVEEISEIYLNPRIRYLQPDGSEGVVITNFYGQDREKERRIQAVNDKVAIFVSSISFNDLKAFQKVRFGGD
jgi:hypothetical protein